MDKALQPYSAVAFHSLRSTLLLPAVFLFALAGLPGVAAQAAEGAAIIQPEALVWAPAAGLPPGAKSAVLYGDPSKAGPFALRFDFPAGYEVATHSHPTDEFITVISGKMRMAFGEKGDAGEAQPLGPAAFMSLPAGAWHHLWVDKESIVELHSTGPFGVMLMK
jgi:quercetin dioxygenase-like cupin family protein